jgi:LytS/YehU family sensor histidine kinase
LFGGTQLVLCAAFTVAWTAWQWTEMRLGARYGAIDASTARTALPWQAFIGFMLYGVLAGTTYAARQWISARDLGIAAERAERLRAQAELASLRAHISPHFLFNTLHSVIALIGTDPSLAGRALEELSELFRYVLRLDREPQDTVALEDEWEFTKRYLWLEQLRMGDRLRIEMRMDEETATSMVPPFTLQPLVENAVRHGIAPKRSGGTIRVVAQECDGSVELEVSDDGVGAIDSEPARAGGLGVRAVRQRLAAQFGTHATSRVETAPGRGYRVVLRFPCAPIGVGTKRITSYAG